MATLWESRWWLSTVGPNIVASVLCFAAGLLAGWLKWGRQWVRRFREHERKVSELHHAIVGPPADEDQEGMGTEGSWFG